MKKLIALAIAGGLSLTGAVFASASADPIDVELFGGGVSVTAAEEGQILLLDGNENNPDPFFGTADGYVGVNGNGVQCGDDGDGYEYADNNNDGDTTDAGEKTATDNGCPAP